MSHNEKVDPRQPDDKAEVPLPPLSHDPIEPDPLNPAPVPLPDTEPGPAERPELNWAEHED